MRGALWCQRCSLVLLIVDSVASACYRHRHVRPDALRRYPVYVLGAEPSARKRTEPSASRLYQCSPPEQNDLLLKTYR
jgi:hypothetical protein